MKIKITNLQMLSLIEEQINKGNSITIRVEGNSMLPFIKGGVDYVELSPITNQKLKTGDIILFRYSQSFVLHRIISINRETITTQGDAITKKTESITIQDVVAITTTIIKKNKRVYTHTTTFRLKSQFWQHLHPVRKLLMKIYIFAKAK
ncbi:hypothetical protein SDC9_142333 [bioreactor metagenome]|uniref:Peptidase S24/S26A/S26B/S26C domain-containing protein n=1 Tax=bioreactor metagenome TaxID=1076179 RepID=A0A645E076_9ZZZZ